MADELAENHYKKLADKKFGEMTDLITRMETDADLVNLVAQYKQIPDVNGNAIPNSVYITLNDAALFAWRVEAALNSVVEQVSVTSDNKRFDTAYAEDFIRTLFKEADKLLPLKDLYPLNPFLDQQTCRRGRVAARCLCRIEEGELTPDITPFDTRYFTYWMGKKGLAGEAYKTTRSKDQILYEYPNAEVADGSGIETMDIWALDSKQVRNEVWIGGSNLILGKTFSLDYVPVVFRKVPMGSMLLDADSLKFQGESIFFLIRDLLPELNRLVSIVQSMNLKALDRAQQLKIPQANIDPGMKVKGHDEANAPGTVNVVPAEGGYYDMPISQLQQQAELLHRMIQDRIDRSTQTFMQSILQPKTATEILGIAQERGDAILPRLGTRGLLKQGLAEMAIKQTIQAVENEKVNTVKMGGREWDIGKLKGEYEIEFKYSFKDQKLDMARISMAATAGPLIPDKAKRRDILQREDPERDERELNWEESGRIFELVKMNRLRRSTGEESDEGEPGAEEELKIITIQEIAALKKAMAGELTPNQPEEVKPSRPLIPAMERVGG